MGNIWDVQKVNNPPGFNWILKLVHLQTSFAETLRSLLHSVLKVC